MRSQPAPAPQWGASIDFQKRITEMAGPGITFRKTKDGLFWGAGQQDGAYAYIVASPDMKYMIGLFCAAHGPSFVQYSSWMINQARQAIIEGNEFYFVKH